MTVYIGMKVVNSFSVKAARPANDAVHLISLVKQQLCEVGSVLIQMYLIVNMNYIVQLTWPLIPVIRATLVLPLPLAMMKISLFLYGNELCARTSYYSEDTGNIKLVPHKQNAITCNLPVPRYRLPK